MIFSGYEFPRMRSALVRLAFNKALKGKERVLLIILTLGAAVPDAFKIYDRPNLEGCCRSVCFVHDGNIVGFALRSDALLLSRGA